MQRAIVMLAAAFAFSLIGLLAACAIVATIPANQGRRPDFEQAMCIVLPLGGAVIGWFGAYLALPFQDRL